jgi:hypothetical protein
MSTVNTKTLLEMMFLKNKTVYLKFHRKLPFYVNLDTDSGGKLISIYAICYSKISREGAD